MSCCFHNLAMSLSTEIGMRVSRSCLSQQFSPFKLCRSSVSLIDNSHKGLWKKCESYSALQRRTFLSVFRIASSDHLSCRVSTGVTRKSVWCFATECPGYRDGYSTIREGILLDEHEGVEKGQRRRLVMYSKPGCCLCDGLKEKLQLVFMMGGEDDLSNTELEVFCTIHLICLVILTLSVFFPLPSYFSTSRLLQVFTGF